MAETNAPSDAPQFLKRIYPTGYEQAASSSSRPYITLTYAQSLDGCIAGVGGKQILLSGKESMVMTHWMRTMHDGILVGSNTLRNDNPQLNTRQLPPRAQPYPQPRPIILDTNMRMPLDCKLLQNYKKGTGMQPWIVCGKRKSYTGASSPTEVLRAERKDALEAAGARIIEVAMDDRFVDLAETLAKLKELGIRSLMVEGGATVIATFLDMRERAETGGDRPIVDMHIVTVAPVMIGAEGVQAGALISKIPEMEPLAAEVFGKDAVFASKLSSKREEDSATPQ